MFSDFKKRMSAVIQEGRTISETLSNTYIRQQQSPAHSPSHHHTLPSSRDSSHPGYEPPFPADSTAGCAHLAQQERSWKEIHKGTEANAAAAEQIDGQIRTILANTGDCMTQLSDLNSSLGCIPDINRQLVKCTDLVQSIGRDCANVQKSLFELEDLLEVLQLQERQLDKKFEMAMYRDKKMAELEKVRQELVGKHDTNVRQYEKQLRLVQQERQAVFQDAFQEDLRSYHTLGTIPKVEHLISDPTAPQMKLEEIVLDTNDDSRQLDEFLNN